VSIVMCFKEKRNEKELEEKKEVEENKSSVWVWEGGGGGRRIPRRHRSNETVVVFCLGVRMTFLLPLCETWTTTIYLNYILSRASNIGVAAFSQTSQYTHLPPDIVSHESPTLLPHPPIDTRPALLQSH
jgi:hypothetical protein